MKKVLAALAFAALPVTASAADFDYRYADVAFSKAYSDFAGYYGGQPPVMGGQGYLLDGSFGIGEHWFVEAAYRQNRFHQDYYGPNPASFVLTPKSLRLGGGLHWAISDHTDLVGHLDLGRAKTTSEVTNTPYPSQHIDDHGYVVGMGLRVQATDALELDLGLDHDNLGFGEQFVSQCYFGSCFPQLQDRQKAVENVVATALRYRFGVMGVGLEYRSSGFEGWHELLLSLRANF